MVRRAAVAERVDAHEFEIDSSEAAGSQVDRMNPAVPLFVVE